MSTPAGLSTPMTWLISWNTPLSLAQKIVDVALKDPSLPSSGGPRRAFPVPVFDAMPVPRVEATPLRAVYPTRSIPSVPVAALPTESPWQGSQPTMGRILDRAASSELESLMRNQDRRRNRGPRINLAFSANAGMASKDCNDKRCGLP